MNRSILITGGAGFIGSHVVRRFVTKYPHYRIINLDALTYAGDLRNVRDVSHCRNYRFIHGNIKSFHTINSVMHDHAIDGIIHLAAESHVDRSISDPMEFVSTNIIGTVNLLNAARSAWKDDANNKLFYHISTDEVYGSLHIDDALFTEDTPYKPKSPYSASKAASDHLVRAYGNTYGLPFVISNCSNNYGPHQFPEKLIPVIINNIVNRKPIPVYGKGDNVRDWLYVEDHVEAIDTIFHRGRSGETYNIGSDNEQSNISLVKKMCAIMDVKLDRQAGESAKLISFVTDRLGHDFRYAIDASKLKMELGWMPRTSFDVGLNKTIDWYISQLL